MNNIEELGIGDIVENNYCEYGKFINEFRAIPYILDGLKPSYRRVLYKSLQNKGVKQKTSTLVGETLVLHPHAENSIKDVITNMANKGLMEPLGNFGMTGMYSESSPAAAPRYTHTKINPNWYSVLSPLLNEVPYRTSEADAAFTEPEYLPTPIPILLTTGSFGMGLAISTEFPGFTPDSIIKCYREDNPSLLKLNYDLDLDEDSDLDGLWRYGYGKIVYKYRVTKAWSEDGADGVYIEGDTQLFKPDWSTFEDWQYWGYVFIRDESVGNKGKVFIGRNKGVRSVNQDMIYEEALRCSRSDSTVIAPKLVKRIAVHDGKIARYISMKEWVDTCYQNYLSLIDNYKVRNINRLNFDKEVYSRIDEVAKIIISNPRIDESEIHNQIDIDDDVLNAILRKSIRTLMKVDSESELNKIESDISWYNNLKGEDYIDNFIKNVS